MFSSRVSADRRRKLRENLSSGLVLFLGNDESPINYPANQYPFRQDSSFLYFFGHNKPGLAGLIDLDSGKDCLYGDNLTLEDVVWMGAQPTIQEMAHDVGVDETNSSSQLKEKIRQALSLKRPIHFLPPYRGNSKLRLAGLLDLSVAEMNLHASLELIRAVVALRSLKSNEEIEEIENALAVTHAAYAAIARSAKPGVSENAIVGKIQDAVASHGRRFAYPIILSAHGETLHNLDHGNVLKAKDILLVDCGSESLEGYASDITRTFPVGGKFTPEQRDVYQIVWKTQTEAIAAIKPGVPYREIHLKAASVIASGLKEMGLMRGDTQAAVESGAHALFFPHGLGHMLGLDVHDMEGLGEDHVGYDETVQRSTQFGLGYLRLAKKLQTGNVLTVEPGIYFIPPLIDQWKAENKFSEFIDYSRVEKFRDARGTRIEDDVLVTENGFRMLGKPIPRTVEEIEAAMST